jgi:hypothetical protein
MSENRIELQDNRDSLSEGEPVTIRCPWCESGVVRVDSPIALYVGRPVTVSSSSGTAQFHAGVPLGRCNRCNLPAPIEAVNT